MITDADREVVGMLDLCNFNPQHCRAEVGIVVDEPYRGKGYAEAALQQLIDYAHSVLHLHQLYAVMCVENVSCIRLFERMGFEHEGLLKAWLFDGDRYQDAVILAIFL
jgi:diamine N-acetyltransferase